MVNFRDVFLRGDAQPHIPERLLIPDRGNRAVVGHPPGFDSVDHIIIYAVFIVVAFHAKTEKLIRHGLKPFSPV
jgi:hypothetical protein